ncbi:MAG: hypothetical protein ACTHME_09975 [Candidatus Nitrosocosmicus sp.]
MIISNRSIFFSLVFLLATISFLGSKITISYEQTNLIPDKSSITKTTDCIDSIITSIFMRFNSDCSNNISELGNKSSNSTMNTDLLSIGIDSKNNGTSLNSAINGDTLVKSDPALSLDNPSSFAKSLQLDQNLSLVNSSSSLQSVDSKLKSDISSNTNDQIKNLLDKNKHGKEIFECFNRAIASLNSLPDSAIIKCAKNHNSFI